MFARKRRRSVEWFRVAQFEPIRVEGAPIAADGGEERPNGHKAVGAGMRVVLARDPDKDDDLNIVVVKSPDERRLGYLPAEVADWVAPLLDSSCVAFDGRIYAVEPARGDSTNCADSFYLTLTQFERRPVERFSLTLTFRGLLNLPVLTANWCCGHAAAIYHAFSRTPAPPSDR
ncbi:MAG TPA: HIRAN domain-containing protein [Planctomycetaceae bacterium]|jgi:hypothetical protein|nr:HIRAN domain-containing protein [Planctomycetaceae bacterium]